MRTRKLVRQGLVVLVALTAAATGSLSVRAAASTAAATPCPDPARVDTGSAGGTLFVLCSTNPGRGAMDKELWTSHDGGISYQDAGPAPRKGITTTFAVASATTVGFGTAAADQCTVAMTWDAGASWQETLTVTDGAPASDLTFTDADHGSVVCGFEGAATTYRTADGGRTWAPVAATGALARSDRPGAAPRARGRLLGDRGPVGRLR